MDTSTSNEIKTNLAPSSPTIVVTHSTVVKSERHTDIHTRESWFADVTYPVITAQVGGEDVGDLIYSDLPGGWLNIFNIGINPALPLVRQAAVARAMLEALRAKVPDRPAIISFIRTLRGAFWHDLADEGLVTIDTKVTLTGE